MVLISDRSIITIFYSVDCCHSENFSLEKKLDDRSKIMGQNIKFKELSDMQSSVQKELATVKTALTSLQTANDDFTDSKPIKGQLGDAIDTYFQEVHSNLVIDIAEVVNEIPTILNKYVGDLVNVDTSATAIIHEDHVKHVTKLVEDAVNKKDDVDKQVRSTLSEIDDIVSITIPDDSPLRDAQTTQAKNANDLLTKLQQFDTNHQNDFSDIKTLMDGINANLKLATGFTSKTFTIAETQKVTEAFMIANANLIIQMGDKFATFLTNLKSVKGWADKIKKFANASMIGKLFKLVHHKNGTYEFMTKTAGHDMQTLYAVVMGKDKSKWSVLRKIMKDGLGSVSKQKLGRMVTSFKNSIKGTDVGNIMDNMTKIHGLDLDSLKGVKRVPSSLKAMGGTFVDTFKDAAKSSMSSPKKWIKDFKEAGKWGRRLKLAGAAATVYTTGEDIIESQWDGFQMHDTTDVAVDVAVDAGVNWAAAATGAAIGSMVPIPVVGTVVGAAVGIGVSWLANWKGPDGSSKSVVENVKDTVKDKVTGLINGVGRIFNKGFSW